MEGAHVKEELVLLLLIVAKQGWRRRRRRRRRRGCSYEQSLILKAEDMYLVRFIPKINQYKHLYRTPFYIDIASSKEHDTLMPVEMPVLNTYPLCSGKDHRGYEAAEFS
jgi:hypothetical protein